MRGQRRLTISNPAIGGSGYLTLANMQADAAILEGFHVAIHQCRGLAQAGGPLCVDVVIGEEEVVGAVPHSVDYVNGFELTEAWRVSTSVDDFDMSFSRGVVVLAEMFVERPILVTARRRGLRYPTAQEFVEKYRRLMDHGCDLRLVTYDFKKHGFPRILKGPFSFGVLVADLELRHDTRLVTFSKDAALRSVLDNVPTGKPGTPADKRKELNRQAFEKGYEARRGFSSSASERILFI